ncbi:hypothetical protein G6E13_000951 [Salmonella enterica subsp. diarizonae]|nr:hypothetical protein [Salmonella enterica subsp. diarizonae]
MSSVVTIMLELVFPAPAGINRVICRDNHAGIGVPRASGDKPKMLIA